MSLNNKGSFLVMAAVSCLICAQYGQCRDRGFSYTQSVIQNNLTTRRAQLNQQISQNLAAGKLHPSEAASLRDRLQRLADLQLTYSEDSALNERETNYLVSGYAQVTSAMNNYLNSRADMAPQYRWNSKYNRFYKNSKARALALKIDRAVVNGLVTPPEAERMRSRYLSEGPRYNTRLNELSGLLNRLIDTRTAQTKFRHWD